MATRAEREQFVSRMLQAVEVARLKKGVFNAQAAVAQAALEGNWGQSLLAGKYNNLFGQKAGTSWRGQTVVLWTKEYWGGTYHRVLSKWRVYPSWSECLVDYGKFIAARWWFADSLPHADPPDGDGDMYQWLLHLVDDDVKGEMKWATGPDYVRKVMRVYQIVAAVRPAEAPAPILKPAAPTPSLGQIIADTMERIHRRDRKDV